MYTHVLKLNKEKFDSVVDGENVTIIRFPKRIPQVGEVLLHEFDGEQKSTTITEISGGEGLMKNWYLVQHEMKKEEGK